MPLHSFLCFVPGQRVSSCAIAGLAASLIGACLGSPPMSASEPVRNLDRFERQILTDVYYSEGINAGDLDGDGQLDIVHGPYWYVGPNFVEAREIFPARAQNRQGYSDHFFHWVYDLDGDGLNDVLACGLPGTPGFAYRNPGPSGWDQPWSKTQVIPSVGNEAPQFVNLVGDQTPEWIFTDGPRYAYATFEPGKGLEPWKITTISNEAAPAPFGHGLGVGDVDSDGRQDLLCKDGWYQQPETLGGNWPFHPFAFADAGADMFADDVDGDGDADVITSLQAHAFGLAWYEQIQVDGKSTFRKHLIMGEKPEDNPYGVLFTELHSVALADLDGDGLKDIVTGKTYWSHHTGSPMWDAGAVVYWFRRVITSQGVEWVPMLAEPDSGIGRQLVVKDVDGDGLDDILVGGMKGASLLRHRREEVDVATFHQAVPRATRPLADGLEPEAAAAAMTVSEGFRVTLAAGEPNVHQPIAMTIDAQGRLWVAEAYTYPLRAPEGEGRDKIVILEDQDLDGRYETRKVFAEGLNLVSGLEVGFGGVWVGAAPYLLFLPDANGDDVPDGEPQVLLDGFGWHDTHETLNGFIWGPDGWLYGCHGVFTHSKVGKPGTPDDQRVALNAGVWRYHPIDHRFEVFAWGTSNPWGVDFNDWGDAFITACVIPHLYHVIPGARYQRQAGEHFQRHTYDDIKTIADHLHYVGSIADHAWWGHEPLAPTDTLSAGGGHAHCGAMIYLGDNWPDSYRNRIFMNNIHGNRVNCDILEPIRSGYVGRHGQDLMIANDRWYRGINLRTGPDGTVFVIDWYDPNACHRTNPEIWDRSNGRVFNVAYGEPQREKVDLDSETDLALVELQLHENDWYCRIARRILQHRASQRPLDQAAVKRLERLASSDNETSRRLRALWTMQACDLLDGERLAKFAQDADPHVRRWGIRLSTSETLVDPAVSAWEAAATSEDEAAVRLEMASAMQKLPLTRRWAIAEALCARAEDADDHNLPLMIWYGVEPLVTEDPSRALKLAAESKIPTVTAFIYRRCASDDRLLQPVVAALQQASTSGDTPTTEALLAAMLQAFEGRVDVRAPEAWTAAYDSLAQSDSAVVRDQADRIAVAFGDLRVVPRMRQIVVDAEAGIERRQRALEILVKAQDREASAALHQALEIPELRRDVIRALASLGDASTGERLLNSYGNWSVEERQDAVNTLVGRPAYVTLLLDAIAVGKVPRTDLHAYQVRQIAGFGDEKLTERVREVWGEVRTSPADRLQRMAALRELASGPKMAAASAGRGRVVFDKTCSNCHRLFDVGGDVGPDITGSNRANLDYVLENMVDPSAVMGNDYRMTLVETDDGRLISGMVRLETDSALTIRTLNDTVVVAKDEIVDRQLSELSMMPEGLLDALDEQAICDLIQYLGSPRQVAPRGEASPIDAESGKVPGAIEGESIEIVGKSAGQAASQGMEGFPADRWSGSDQLWWTGAKPGDVLEVAVPVDSAGVYSLEVVLTMARDYGVVQLELDGQPLGSPIDCYNDPEVITTGVLRFDGLKVDAGKRKLGLKIVGANPAAVPVHMVGLDYARWVPSTESTSDTDADETP